MDPRHQMNKQDGGVARQRRLELVPGETADMCATRVVGCPGTADRARSSVVTTRPVESAGSYPPARDHARLKNSIRFIANDFGIHALASSG